MGPFEPNSTTFAARVAALLEKNIPTDFPQSKQSLWDTETSPHNSNGTNGLSVKQDSPMASDGSSLPRFTAREVTWDAENKTMIAVGYVDQTVKVHCPKPRGACGHTPEVIQAAIVGWEAAAAAAAAVPETQSAPSERSSYIQERFRSALPDTQSLPSERSGYIQERFRAAVFAQVNQDYIQERFRAAVFSQVRQRPASVGERHEGLGS